MPPCPTTSRSSASTRLRAPPSPRLPCPPASPRSARVPSFAAPPSPPSPSPPGSPRSAAEPRSGTRHTSIQARSAPSTRHRTVFTPWRLRIHTTAHPRARHRMTAQSQLDTQHRRVHTVGYGAFTSCCSLTRVSLPASLTSLSSCAFKGCTALARVRFPDDVAASTPRSVTFPSRGALPSPTSTSPRTSPTSATTPSTTARRWDRSRCRPPLRSRSGMATPSPSTPARPSSASLPRGCALGDGSPS
mmetsp:Transcript_50046/g.167238  ORF Transcript_50046/g.167238 Transcript_50046/m.167238 type:complete len:246 (+) Transcript_50046:587-1324(+)